MTRAILIALAVSLVAAPAAGGELGHRKDKRAFWLEEQGWPNPQPQAAPSSAKRQTQEFTKTYMDGVARRFGAGSGHMDLFERKLGGDGGLAPQLAGTVDGGGAKIVLRWHPGE